MAVTKYDILDVVTTAVKFIHGPHAPDVRLGGNNIFIGNKPVSIAAIDATTHNMKRFVKLIKGAM